MGISFKMTNCLMAMGLGITLLGAFATYQADAANLEAPKVNVSVNPAFDTKPDPYLYVKPVPVGKLAPDFQATTADGRSFQLTGLKGKKLAVLIFYQGHFCTVCGQQLSNLQKHYQDFQKQGADIIAISADELSNAQLTLGEKGLAFTVIPDPQKAIIKKFGVNNVSKQGIAWPSVFIVDKSGMVRFNYADYSGHRLHSNELLAQLSKLTGKPSPKLGYDD